MKLWSLGLIMALAGCAGIAIPPARTNEAAYSEIFPYYAEVCALSGLGKKPDFGVELTSGPGGHAVLYLNNVCRAGDGSGQLQLCSLEVPPNQRGVGLSVNAHYKNTAWVATPGRDFFFDGTLPAGAPLTRENYAATKLAAENLGIYDGVTFNEEYFNDLPPGVTRRDWQYELSIATDYATDFGRARLCARAPLDKTRMQDIINYLNGLNEPFRNGSEDFRWDLFTDNCSHMAHNALASAGIWPDWPAGRLLISSIFDFPVPKNEFINLMQRTNDVDITNVVAVYRDPALRADLLHYNTLPTAPGGLAEAAPIATPNEVYDTKARLIFYDYPFFGAYQATQDRIFSEPRYTDLAANLQYFSGLYARIEAERVPAHVYDDQFSAAEFPAFAAFHARYYAYIERQAALVAAAQTQLH